MNQKLPKIFFTGLLQILREYPNTGFFLEIIFALCICLHGAIYQVYLDIRILNNLIALTELFPTPDLRDWRIPLSLSLSLSLYIYIYIYIYWERERERENFLFGDRSVAILRFWNSRYIGDNYWMLIRTLHSFFKQKHKDHHGLFLQQELKESRVV